MAHIFIQNLAQLVITPVPLSAKFNITLIVLSSSDIMRTLSYSGFAARGSGQ